MEAFDAREIEERYAFLDDCPEHLFQEIVTFPVGTLEERVFGIREWRESLLGGRLPAEETWPPKGISEPARVTIHSLGFLRFCKGQEELVDTFLRDVLLSFVRQTKHLQLEIASRLRELEELERQRLENGLQQQTEQDRRDSRRWIRLDEATLARLQQQAEQEVMLRAARADEDLSAAWSERVRAWAAISEVFGDLSMIMGRGWDLSVGVLKHTGWSDVVRLHELIKKLPQLREIVQSLGRLHVSDTRESVVEAIFAPVQRLEEEQREVWTRNVPTETRGIERSGEIARMLPAEAASLGHPKLRYLWHARRAERALLTYRIEGIEGERSFVERESKEVQKYPIPRKERGPILAVMDTSGSMYGLPETVAKALVLEALRTAHQERRRCFLYSYSGPGQIQEQELDLSIDGIGRLLYFLSQSFGGGNDEVGVMTKVVQRLSEEDWKKADVVFVSDGEWPAPTALLHLVERARAVGTRFHGIQIGNRGRTGLHAICDPVHIFQDWATAGGW